MRGLSPKEVQVAVEHATPGWVWSSGYRTCKRLPRGFRVQKGEEQIVWAITQYDGSGAIRFTIGTLERMHEGLSVKAEVTVSTQECAPVAAWLFRGGEDTMPVPAHMWGTPKGTPVVLNGTPGRDYIWSDAAWDAHEKWTTRRELVKKKRGAA